MTATEAVRIAQGFSRLSLWNYLFFLGISLAYGGLTVLSPDIHETLAYADMRKVMALGYTLMSVTMLLIALHFSARSNASLKLAQELMFLEVDAERIKSIGLFRPTSTLWPLCFMAAIIIVVNYIVLIYAVDGGLF